MAVPKSRGLWDSDDEDVVLSLGKAKATKVSQQIRSKPSLFDSADEEDTFIRTTSKKETTLFNSEPTNGKDFEVLYVSEVAKRKELEGVIAKLQDEVAALKIKLSQACVDDLDLTHNPIVENNKDAEWEALARDEKQRRQRAIQQKATRQRTVNKRVAATTAPATAASVEDTTTRDTDIGVVPMHTIERVPQGRHYMDSDDGEDEALVQPKHMHSDELAVGVSAAPSLSPTNTEGGESESEKASFNKAEESVVEDPETVKWRELAAQEKARKALARRSVRVVRRGGNSGSGGAEGGVSGDGAVKHKHLLLSAYTQIKSSNSLQNLAVSATASITTTSTTTATVESTTSVSHSTGASIAHASADSRPRNHTHSDSESDWDTNSHSDDTGEDDNTCVGENISDKYTRGSGSPPVDSITVAEEAALDRRLRAWASGKSIAQLLCTLPAVVELATQELLTSRDVTAAAEALSFAIASGSSSGGQSASGDVRKAYMRVIRHCHPDKHMHLPPRSPAFLELQKIFTVLSDSYNRYKATQS